MFKVLAQRVDLTTVATRPTFRALATPGPGSHWIVSIPELEITAQARHFGLVESVARDAIAERMGVAPRSFNLEVTDCDDTTRPLAIV
jgi:hypothetical protein